MVAVSMALSSFKESLLSPWAKKLRPAGGGRTSLLDVVPPAQKNPTEVIGCISYINSYLSEEGLHRRNTLPPVIFDLYSPPPSGARDLEEEEEEEGGMTHRRGRVVRKKKPPSRIDRQDYQKIPPIISKETKAVLEEIDSPGAADTLLIELATYPGFNHHSPTPLPHGLSTLDQMKRVTSSQTKLSTKQEWYRETWCKLFYSPDSQAIFLDYFWWFFLHKYQTNQHSIQDLLFTRMSHKYVKMLCEPIEISTKDTFFKMYPDVIAQCVYTTLLHAYPNSWNNFDEDFKSELCRYISLWQVGTKPMPNSWTRWELYRLEPPNLPKLETRSEEQGGFDFDALLEEAKEKAEKDSNLESYFEKRLSLNEVKRRLSCKKNVLGEFSGNTTPSTTDEKSMGIAMRQLARFDNKAASMAQLTPCSTPQPCSTDKLTPGLSDLKESLLDPGEGPATARRQLTPEKQQQVSQSKAKGPRHKMIKITNPEGQDVESESSNPSSRGARPRRDSATPQVKKQHRLAATTQRRTYPAPKKQQGRTMAPTLSKQKTADQKQVKTLPQPTNPQYQRKALQNPAMRAISAPAFSPSGIRTSSFDSTPIPTLQSKTPPTNSENKSSEEYFSYKKMALSLKEKAERRESATATLKGPAFDHVVFNLYGHSPLVKHYMDNKNLTHENEKEVVVGRTEIAEEPPRDAVCYRDVLTRSRTTGDTNRQQFQRHYRFQRHSMITADKKRVVANQEHEQNVKLVLGNKREVQQLSNELALHAMQSKLEYNKQAVSNVIGTSLKRASMTTSTIQTHPN